jgi:hypothetical protein
MDRSWYNALAHVFCFLAARSKLLMTPQDGSANTPSNSQNGKQGDERREPLDKALFSIVTLLIVIILLLLGVTFYVQYKTYSRGLEIALASNPISHVTVLSYLRALEAALTKLSSLFLSFILIYVGALYVLRTAQVAYSLSSEASGAKAALQTSSPGLVLVTLGVLALGLALYRSTTIDLKEGSPEVNQQAQLQQDSVEEAPAKLYKPGGK